MKGFTTGLPIRRVGHDDAFGDPGFLREALRTADELGFWGVTAPDHIVAPNAWAQAGGGEAWPDPFVLLGYAAGITTRLRLITHIIVLPYRSPFAVAKAIASLDAISGGRAVLGAGSGYLREEFEILGIPFEQRGARTDEALRAIRACWTDGDIDFDGEYSSIHEARLAPQPVRASGPPVWIGGNSMRALRRAVELGDCWAPFDVTDEQLRAGIARAESLGRRVEVAAPVGRIARDGTSGVTGDAVAERIRALRDAGVDRAKCGFGGGSPDAWLANMRWFAQEVMPAFEQEG